MKGVKKVLIFCLMVLAISFAYQPAFSAEKINLNTATIAQLVELKGVGEKTAQHIIEYREKKKFETIDELINVKGIGDKTLAKIRDQIMVAE